MYPVECDCSYTDGDPAAVANAVMRRARKRHRCVECNEHIEMGAIYEALALCCDGSWSHWKTCLPCTRIRERFCPHGSLLGELSEQVRDCLGFDYRDDPSDWDQEDVDEEDEANREYWTKLRAEGRK